MAPAKKYTVVPDREGHPFTEERETVAYLALMMEWGLTEAPPKEGRLPDGPMTPGGARTVSKDATCVWDDEQEAQAFATELAARTKPTKWIVKEYPSE
jgi:hypothetical protein